MVSTIEKGDELENRFYQYLLDQKERGDLVFGAYPPHLCKVYKKKQYYCIERNGNVTFDVVIEFFRQGGIEPHFYVIFECKNYKGAIPEDKVTDFSDKIGRIFQHAAKGVMVISSRLQSGAENIAKNRKLGIVKFDGHGIDIVADRKNSMFAEQRFVKHQIFEDQKTVKPLKFSAYYDGRFYGSIGQFLISLDSSHCEDGRFPKNCAGESVPYVSFEAIRDTAHDVLTKIAYENGPVDLNKICSSLCIDLKFTNSSDQNEDGILILGSMNFDQKSIIIHSHNDKNRERFTIAHEVGHFCLKHDRYLRSEFIVERDLIIHNDYQDAFNYERLEYQANTFASDLILPKDVFLIKTEEYRRDLEIKDRGFGYIFVDDQPCNYMPYSQLLTYLSSYFEVSKQAIEIKFKTNGMITDQRKNPESFSFPPIISELGA